MALRVAIGTVDEPASPEAAVDLIMTTLPWRAWPDALPELVVVDQSNTEIIRCKPAAPLMENSPFLEALRASVLARGEGLAKAGTLRFAFGGKHLQVEDHDREDGEPPLAISWPGLMSTLNTLASPTPSALKCTWYFGVERDKVAEVVDGNWQLKAGMAISVAPASVLGSNYTSSARADDPTVHVHFYDSGEVQAHCELLNLDDALAHGNVDELDNYWLSIRDSRDHSLLDLAARLEAALSPAAMLSAISIDEWASACVTAGPGIPERPATVGETQTALNLWKGRAEIATGGVADKRRGVIKDALLSPDDTVEAIRAGYGAKARETLAFLLDVSHAGAFTTVHTGAMPSLVETLRDRLLPAFIERNPGPCQPDEGIELMVGSEQMRLRHEAQMSDPAIDDVAAIQFFGRRSSDVEQLDLPEKDSTAKWHALTGARYAVPLKDDDETFVVSTDRVLGVTAGYVDEVLYRELTYSGANLVCRNPLEGVHRERLSDPDDKETSMMLARLERRVSSVWELRALPLRYGDHYEFAASVIDRAGGQASELCKAGTPWEFDPDSISRLAPPQRDRVRFLRRVAVGHCNVLPPAGGWPQTPEEVWLRCLEEAPPPAENVPQPASVLLVPAGKEFLPLVGSTKGAGWSASVSFRVEAPRLDEHTLMRWNMPATTLPPAAQKAAVEALIEALHTIHSTRDAMLAEGSAADSGGLPFDPAVTALGVRYQFDGQGEERHIVIGQAMDITVACGDLDHFEASSGTLHFYVMPGSHVRLGFVPLIAPEDFERMDQEALSALLELQPPLEPWRTEDGKPYGAFAETVVFAESASASLPTLQANDLLLQADAAGNVEVRYAFSGLDVADQRLLRHVHQMRISCERWVWRNLPFPARQPVDAKTPDAELRRRLASGPPAEIMDPARRDAPDSELVSYFDELAGIDQGFVRREEVILRFPRDRSDKIELHVDRRDGIAAADYLRYALTLRSRYRGVLKKKEGDTVGPRRIALPFRGSVARIKPPKLLAVLPLTSAMKESPHASDKDAGSAFLVILDESWFREYGIGERLRARISRVKAEVGEETEPSERRYGPLPDHSVQVPKGDELDRLLEEDLDCFGPFGFSLDRGSSQAMANATGFVVYPPRGTPPHYNLFVEFARLLDLPSGEVTGEGTLLPFESTRSDALPLYTLPDSDALNPKGDSLNVAKVGDGAFSFDAKAVAPIPFAGATGEVLLQYRYLLIAGRKVRDGGRGVDVFLPQHGLWLTGGLLKPLGGGKPDISGCDAAVIAEVLLNGRPGGADPFDQASDLRDFFLKLFGDTEQDAPGMIRRFSQVFELQHK
jgi:hypothetical protein